MRSSSTAGLTSQQLLERRRAQNKLAQRRFREKARLARAMGSASALGSDSCSSSGMGFGLNPGFGSTRHLALPAHLDLSSASSHDDLQARGRSASAGSACSSSSASQSSQMSSPTSSCAELLTPVMPTFIELAKPRAAKAHTDVEASALMDRDLKAEQDWAPIASLYTDSYASFDPSQHIPTPIMAAPAPMTFSTLVCPSGVSCNVGLKMVGMHSDPLLLNQALPSPSVLPPPLASHSMPSSTMFMNFEPMAPVEPTASFDYLLRLPSTPSSASDCSEAASYPSTDSRSSVPFDKAISEHVARAEPQLSQPTRSVAITSLSFASVAQAIASRFGLAHNGDGLRGLLSRLELFSKSGSSDLEPAKGLVFDAGIDWDSLSSNMLPTTEQLLYPHRAFLDACLPWPAVRSRLVKHALAQPVCEEELALDLLLSILSTDEGVASFHVYGDDVLDPEAWELSERMLQKWWGLFDDSILRRTNWWRRQRGLTELSMPAPTNSSNAFERQGLGTGSLDQAHRLASTLL